jgi:hypothetical protein
MAVKVCFVFAENIRWWAILSGVIMRVQNTTFSHCAIAMTDPNFATIFHSEWPVGYSVDMKEWSKSYKIKHLFTFNVDDKTAAVMMHWLSNQVRKPYSIKQLFLILAHKYMPSARPFLPESVNGDYADICTEFVASFMEKFFAVDIKKSDDLIDLNDVFEMARNLKGVQ